MRFSRTLHLGRIHHLPDGEIPGVGQRGPFRIVPGMDSAPAVSDLQVLVRLAILTVLWADTVLHLLRLLDGTRLLRRDLMIDAAHASMGAAMAFMLFPGAPVAVQPVLAGGFAALTIAFLLRSLTQAHRRRAVDFVVAGSSAAMVLMLAGAAHPGRITSLVIACCLIACAAVHAHRLLTRPSTAGFQEPRLFLETGPHLTAAGMTLIMASMFAFT